MAVAIAVKISYTCDMNWNTTLATCSKCIIIIWYWGEKNTSHLGGRSSVLFFFVDPGLCYFCHIVFNDLLYLFISFSSSVRPKVFLQNQCQVTLWMLHRRCHSNIGSVIIKWLSDSSSDLILMIPETPNPAVKPDTCWNLKSLCLTVQSIDMPQDLKNAWNSE